MFQRLEIFQLSYAMAKHAGDRQAIVAKNMANADTPGYRAQDLTPFKETVEQFKTYTGQKATRPAHLSGRPLNDDPWLGAGAGTTQTLDDKSQSADPNGNTVSIETEILRSVDAKRQHDRALAIYRSSLNVLRNALGRG